MHLPSFTKILVASALLSLPLALQAQTPTPAAASPRPAASPEKTQRNPPFRGTITSADAAAQTFTIQGKVKTRVFKVTSETKLLKRAGGAATFADLKAGEYVTGSAKKLGEGQFEAESVKVGPKEPKPEATPTASASAAASPSPSASRRSTTRRNSKSAATPAASPSAAQ
ncbi:MAG: hypothetical protein JO295_09320 [Verrucomicrobia bacterium]|nr:hypothetical protein [Verrucomicrobiota bacterium]